MTQYPPPPGYGPPPQWPNQPGATGGRRPGPGLGLSLAVTIGAGVVFLIAMIMFIRPIVESMLEDPIVTPGVVTLTLDEGNYSVYERANDFDGLNLTPADVNVSRTDGLGEPLFTRNHGFTSETLEQDSNRYEAVVDFVVPERARYDVDISGIPTQVIVAESIESQIESNIGWLLLAGAAGIVGVIGIVLLIVGIVRRGKARRSGGPGPGGWQQPYPAGPQYQQPQYQQPQYQQPQYPQYPPPGS